MSYIDELFDRRATFFLFNTIDSGNPGSTPVMTKESFRYALIEALDTIIGDIKKQAPTSNFGAVQIIEKYME